MNRETELQHLGEEKSGTGPVVPPIVQTSLFVYPDFDSFWGTMFDHSADNERFIYSRVGNPNLSVVEKKLAMLEKTETCKIFTSGMAAITAGILCSIKAGDHIVAVDTMYGPTKEFILKWLPRFGVTHTLVTGNDPAEIEAACTAETKLIYLESPSSILFRFQDLEAVARFAKSKGIRTMVDNSYASPLFSQPATFGIDLIVHSATKYIGGHSDVVAGALCGSREHLDAMMAEEGQWLGALLPPFPAWLLMRGLRTLPMRMAHSQRTAYEIFEYLKSRPEVDEIFFAGDPDHPQNDLFKKQMSGATSLLSFAPKVQEMEKVKAFVESLNLFQIGVSWGGFESLAVIIPAHPMNWSEPRWVVRLYCGFEHVDDLKADLTQGFEAHLA